MEKQNLNDILLKELEFYNPSATYVNFLNNKNITTVEQLLTASNESDFFKGYSGKTIYQMLGFISMLEYKYLGKPLLCDSAMDEHIDIENNSKRDSCCGTIHTKSNNGEENLVCLDHLFGCPRKKMIPVFDEFIYYANDEFFSQKINLSKDNLKVIDFIRFVAGITKDRFKHIIPYAKAYVESYERQQQLNNEDTETIEALKSQLTNLIEKKDNLDMQINDIQRKIEELQNVKNKGGIKK